MHDISNLLIETLKEAPRPIALHEPSFDSGDISYVSDCVQSGWVSSVGSYVDRFELELSQYIGAHAIPVVNGTAALHLALVIAGVKAGDEVFVPDLTFVATANAVKYCHAIPHFVEAEKNTYGIDPDKLDAYIQTLSRIPKYLIVTHIFGNSAQIDKLCSVCQKHNITLIEDAAESLGSWVDNKHTGTFGKISALSFNGNKIITTGGGGAVITTDPTLAQRAKHLSTTAKTNSPYTHRHDEIGYNYRMPNLNAALGCSQLKKLELYLAQKKKLYQIYADIFLNRSEIEFITPMKNTISNFWLCNILVKDEITRNIIIDELAKEKIFCRGLWAPISSLPMYKNCPKMPTPIVEDLCSRTISLPSSPSLTQFLVS